MLDILERFRPISLEHINKLKFNNRRDKRYIIHRELALKILSEMNREYRLLKVEGDSVINYETSYYDTKAFDLFNKKWTRENYNIRVRNYSTSTSSYIDIKHTISDSLVTKYRDRLKGDDQFRRMIEENTPYLASTLEEKVAIHFNRFTFVDEKSQEKITIDIDLGFTTLDSFESIPELAIVEVKSCKRFYTSMFRPIVGKYSLSPSRCSKYCLGISFMYPHKVDKKRFCRLISSTEKERLSLVL